MKFRLTVETSEKEQGWEVIYRDEGVTEAPLSALRSLFCSGVLNSQEENSVETHQAEEFNEIANEIAEEIQEEDIYSPIEPSLS